MSGRRRFSAVVFDLDGTLLDSDEALIAPFLALGVPRHAVTFGHVADAECRRLGLEPADYQAAYDTTAAQPFAEVIELLGRLDRWALCSNKHGDAGRAELARLGWEPEVAFFADRFDGPKRLHPVLEALGLDGPDVVFVGDTGHDVVCAREVGALFAVAAWNPRARGLDGDVRLRSPLGLLDVLG